MNTKKNEWSWLWIIIVWFIVASNFPILIPFIIFGIIIYFSIINNWKKTGIKMWGLEKNKIFESLMNSDFIKNQKNENPELFKNLEERYIQTSEKSTYSQSSLKNSKIEKNISKSRIRIPSQNTVSTFPKSKIKPRKPYKSSFSTKMKKGKIYDFNSWKSIWDDYETVIETMAKNK